MHDPKPVVVSRKAVISMSEIGGEVCGATIRIPSFEIVSTILPQPDLEMALDALKSKLEGGRYTLINEHTASSSERAYLTEAYRRGEKISNMIHEFCMGKDIRFSEKLDLSSMTLFKKKVLLTVKSIPRGKTASYSWVAERAGYPRGCRAVGNVMSTNPFPPIVPCHRVVRSGGEIGNFGSGIKLKKKLLTQEKVVFKGEKIIRHCLLTGKNRVLTEKKQGEVIETSLLAI